MQKITYYCDVCGRQMDFNENRLNYDLTHYTETKRYPIMQNEHLAKSTIADLCNNCSDKIHTALVKEITEVRAHQAKISTY